MKSNHEAHILHTALSPVFHQAPNSKGKNISYQRMLPMVGRQEDGKLEYVMVPCISGNARRSIARRDLIRQTLEILEIYKDDQYDTNLVRPDLIMALINGGSLAAGASAEPKIKAKQETYDKLPFFGLFGGCYRQVWFGGRLSAGFAYMLTPDTCRLAQTGIFPFEIEPDMLPELKSSNDDNFRNWQGYTRQRVPGLIGEDRLSALLLKLQEGEYPQIAEKIVEFIADPNEENIKELNYIIETNPGAEEILKNFFKSDNDKKNNKKITEQIKALSNNQMIYSIDYPIPAGAILLASDYLLPGPGDDEIYEAVFHAYLEKLAERPFIGAMAAKGYGRVKLEIKNAAGQDFKEYSQSDKYWNWLKANKNEVRAYLKEYDKQLFPVK